MWNFAPKAEDEVESTPGTTHDGESSTSNSRSPSPMWPGGNGAPRASKSALKRSNSRSSMHLTKAVIQAAIGGSAAESPPAGAGAAEELDPGSVTTATERTAESAMALRKPSILRREARRDSKVLAGTLGNGQPSMLRRASTYNNLLCAQSLLRGSDAGGGKGNVTGKAATLHAEPSGEVIAINRRSASVLSQLVPRVLRLHPAAVIVFGAFLYAMVPL